MLHNIQVGEGSNQGLGRHVGPNPDDPDPWERENVLSFDGGGVRGLWSLFVLEKLMKYVARLETERFHENHLDQNPTVCSSFNPHQYPSNVSHESVDGRSDAPRCCRLPEQQRFLPCHYFDLICGSSTGALIAIMLGRMRMPVSDCIMEYKNLGGEVFGNPRKIHAMNFPILPINKYNTANFEKVIKNFVNRRLDGDEIHAFESKPDLCRTMVTSWRTGDEDSVAELILLRTYSHARRVHTQQSRVSTNASLGSLQRTQTNQISRHGDTARPIRRGPASRHEIWKVARAASAPPPFFDPMRLDERPYQYEDGGMSIYNNPTHEAIRDIVERNGWSSIGSVVSIGTSRKSPQVRSGLLGGLRGIGKKIIDRATTPEAVHNMVNEQSQDENHPFDYWRFNAEPTSIAALSTPFDEWKPRSGTSGSPAGTKTVADIQKSFHEWLTRDDNSNHLEACAQMLVNARQARAERTESRWARFATCHTFECHVQGCQNRRGDLFYEKDDFEKHLIDEHGMQRSSKQLKDMLWDEEKQWSYKARN